MIWAPPPQVPDPEEMARLAANVRAAMEPLAKAIIEMSTALAAFAAAVKNNKINDAA